MISGVNFQPGGGQQGDPAEARRQGRSGVQEAIRILSLRLPKVVGAQAAVPQALLTGTGSGGSRVDSVVSQVLSRVLPTGQPQQTPTATMPGGPSQPSFSGDAGSPTSAPAMPSWPWTSQPTVQPQQPWTPPAGLRPRVAIKSPFDQGDFNSDDGADPIGGQPATTGERSANLAASGWNQPNLIGSFLYPDVPRSFEI